VIIVLDDEIEFTTPVHADKRLEKLIDNTLEECKEIANIVYSSRDLNTYEISGILSELNYENIKELEINLILDWFKSVNIDL